MKETFVFVLRLTLKRKPKINEKSEMLTSSDKVNLCETVFAQLKRAKSFLWRSLSWEI